jgi:hypothetical protein
MPGRFPPEIVDELARPDRDLRAVVEITTALRPVTWREMVGVLPYGGSNGLIKSDITIPGSVLVTTRPNAQGFYNNWAGGAVKPARMSDQSDATGAAPTTGFQLESYAMADIAADPALPVTEIKAYLRMVSGFNAGGTYRGFVGSRLSGVDLYGYEAFYTTIPKKTALQGFRVVPKPGGGQWTVGDHNNAEIVLQLDWLSGSADPTAVEAWFEVRYNNAEPVGTSGSVTPAPSL